MRFPPNMSSLPISSLPWFLLSLLFYGGKTPLLNEATEETTTMKKLAGISKRATGPIRRWFFDKGFLERLKRYNLVLSEEEDDYDPADDIVNVKNPLPFNFEFLVKLQAIHMKAE